MKSTAKYFTIFTRIVKIKLCILISINLSSCKKVIDLGIENIDPQIVIEGQVSDQGNSYVKLTKTNPLSKLYNNTPILNAFVTISDGNLLDTLKEVNDGYFILTRKFRPQIDKTYSLTVNAEGKTYTAISTMPKAIPIDGADLKLTSVGQSAGDTTKRYFYYVHFNDPAGVQNYYRFTISCDGNIFPNRNSFYWEDAAFQNIFDDKLINGQPNPYPLIGSSNYFVHSGDIIYLNMYCIEENVYKYYYGIRQIEIEFSRPSASPDNPIGNIQGGALGCFSANPLRRVRLVIP
jgi:Domain of unknown function (DUF4249)